MFTFFDFAYLGTYNRLYSDTSDNSPEFSSSCAVAGLQTFNICSVIMLYDVFIEKSENTSVSKLFAGSLIVGLMVVNYIRYIRINKYSLEMIQTRWDKMSLKHKKLYRETLVIYAILSAVLFFGLIIYFARRKM